METCAHHQQNSSSCSSTAFWQGICHRIEHQTIFMDHEQCQHLLLYYFSLSLSFFFWTIVLFARFYLAEKSFWKHCIIIEWLVKKIHITEDKLCDCCRDIHDNPSANWDFWKSQVALKTIKYNWDITMVITRHKNWLRIDTNCMRLWQKAFAKGLSTILACKRFGMSFNSLMHLWYKPLIKMRSFLP